MNIMLYQAYQANDDVVAPFRLMAEATRGFLSHPWPFFGDHPLVRGAAAACEMVSRSGIRHHRPEFGISEANVRGRTVAVTEQVVARHPFCKLLHFAKDSKVAQPRILVVAPLSGHFATLLRCI